MIASHTCKEAPNITPLYFNAEIYLTSSKTTILPFQIKVIRNRNFMRGNVVIFLAALGRDFLNNKLLPCQHCKPGNEITKMLSTFLFNFFSDSSTVDALVKFTSCLFIAISLKGSHLRSQRSVIGTS